jgi:hypothetical protein
MAKGIDQTIHQMKRILEVLEHNSPLGDSSPCFGFVGDEVIFFPALRELCEQDKERMKDLGCVWSEVFSCWGLIPKAHA